MDIAELHHVTLPVSDLEKAGAFYRGVLGLKDIFRPSGRSASGAWFSVGGQQLHLVKNERGAFRQPPVIDQDDVHFALRVRDFAAAVATLRAHGFREAAAEGDPMRLVVTHHRGFPQAYVLDPDRHIVEINAWRPPSGSPAAG